MAYLNAPLLVPSSGAPTFDPVAIGMRDFGNYAAQARSELVTTYTRPSQWYEDIRDKYVEDVAQGIGMVCTAVATQTRRQEVLSVGPGLAARAAAAVLRHETQSRLGLMEAGYKDLGGKYRFGGLTVKRGPVEAMGRFTGYRGDPAYVDEFATWLTSGNANTIARHLRASDTADRPLEAAVVGAIEDIVSAQTGRERTVYRGLPLVAPLIA